MATFPGWQLAAISQVHALHPTPERDLLLKIINGVRDENFFVDLVVHTSDNIFTPSEWNRLGKRCLSFTTHPARLWLAIGANGTDDKLTLFASRVVSKALERNPSWSMRRSFLLEQLIQKVSDLDAALAENLSAHRPNEVSAQKVVAVPSGCKDHFDHLAPHPWAPTMDSSRPVQPDTFRRGGHLPPFSERLPNEIE